MIEDMGPHFFPIHGSRLTPPRAAQRLEAAHEPASSAISPNKVGKCGSCTTHVISHSTAADTCCGSSSCCQRGCSLCRAAPPPSLPPAAASRRCPLQAPGHAGGFCNFCVVPTLISCALRSALCAAPPAEQVQPRAGGLSLRTGKSPCKQSPTAAGPVSSARCREVRAVCLRSLGPLYSLCRLRASRRRSRRRRWLAVPAAARGAAAGCPPADTPFAPATCSRVTRAGHGQLLRHRCAHQRPRQCAAQEGPAAGQLGQDGRDRAAASRPHGAAPARARGRLQGRSA